MPRLGNILKTVVGKKEGRIVRSSRISTGSPLLTAPTVIKSERGHQILVPTSHGEVFCFDEHLKKLWHYQISENATELQKMFLDSERSMSIHAKISPVFETGRATKVVFGSDTGCLYCLSTEGKELWNFPTKGVVRTQPLVADINNDGKSEIIFGSNDSKLYVLNEKGNLIWDFEAEGGITSSPQLMDRTKGDPMIIFGAGNGKTYALSPSGELVWSYDTYGKIVAPPAIGKIYGNDNTFAIVGSYDGDVYALDEYGALRWKYATGGSIFTKPALFDLNGDGKLEIVLGSCDDSVYFLSCSGARIWKYETDFWIIADPLIVDIDNDGTPEIVVGSFDHNIYVLNPQGKYALDYIPGVSLASSQLGHYGEEISENPGEFKGNRIWQYKTDDLVVGLGAYQDSNKRKVLIGCIKNGMIDIYVHQK